MKLRIVLASVARGVLVLALVLGLSPIIALAEEPAPSSRVVDQIAQNSSEAIARVLASGDASSFADPSVNDFPDNAITPMAILPDSFDLRDKGVVSSVKSQQAWGTCWGFGAVAASEISLVSELVSLGVTAEDLDLSELHLAWFAYKALPEDHESGQGGEGVHVTSADPNAALNVGGFAFTATSVFSSGIGPQVESEVPYRNKEGIVVYDSLGNPAYYAPEGDWSVDENLRFLQAVELQESSILPSPAGKSDTEEYKYNSAGTEAIKQEVLDGRAVEICFCADSSRPGQTDPEQYINLDTYAHYTYEDKEANHAVCIVGWDDSYSKDNFLADHQPSGDGAWIVKNSWGALDSKFPHGGDWGIDGSGYFYLSYYDHSLEEPESFDFSTESFFGNEAEGEYYLINQYDYMPSCGVNAIRQISPASMANVFTAEEDQMVRSLATQTSRPNTKVVYELYRLTEGYLNPRDGELLRTIEETYRYGGYHRVELAEGYPMAEGQSYAVVTTQTGNGDYEILADHALNKTGYEQFLAAGGEDDGFYTTGIINRGESFLLENGTWADWYDKILEVRAIKPEAQCVDFDNFAIKAYSDPITLVDPVPDPALDPVPLTSANQPFIDSEGAYLAKVGDEVLPGVVTGCVLLGAAVLTVIYRRQISR